METIKQIKEKYCKFPLWLKRYVDNGGITRYSLINLDRNNYWVKEFNTKEEVKEYFKK